ncbi:N-acetylglucosamine-6-phosphate deacetylase [Agrobacterium tumefaciens]|nr:N-acetylglucosamine-6-phosphate deacetylase [Agrobacterium tumefaciens]
MSSKAFVGARIFDGAGWHDGKVLVTGDGRVGDIADRMSVPPDADIIDAEGLLIAPASSTSRSMAAAA